MEISIMYFANLQLNEDISCSFIVLAGYKGLYSLSPLYCFGILTLSMHNWTADNDGSIVFQEASAGGWPSCSLFYFGINPARLIQDNRTFFTL